MARYGCLALGVILALIILFTVVYLWSGWLNRPVGHSPPPAVAAAERSGMQWARQRHCHYHQKVDSRCGGA